MKMYYKKEKYIDKKDGKNWHHIFSLLASNRSYFGFCAFRWNADNSGLERRVSWYIKLKFTN